MKHLCFLLVAFFVGGCPGRPSYPHFSRDNISSVQVLADGRIALIGSSILVLNADGSIDPNSPTGGKIGPKVLNDDEYSSEITWSVIGISSQDKVLMAQSIDEGIGIKSVSFAGESDSTFGNAGQASVATYFSECASCMVLTDDSIILAVPKEDLCGVLRVDYSGNLDENYGAAADLNGTAVPLAFSSPYAVGLNEDKKIVMACSSGDSEDVLGTIFTRYNSDGSLDTSMGTAGKLAVDLIVSGITRIHLYSDNRFLVEYSETMLKRFLANGTVDTSFGTNGTFTSETPITSVAIDEDGKILFINDDGAQRLKTNGSIDTTFSVALPSGLNGKLTALAPASDGKVILGGEVTPANRYDTDFLAMQVNSNGSIDTSFGKDGIVITNIEVCFRYDNCITKAP